jgi:hypothetical protein
MPQEPWPCWNPRWLKATTQPSRSSTSELCWRKSVKPRYPPPPPPHSLLHPCLPKDCHTLSRDLPRNNEVTRQTGSSDVRILLKNKCESQVSPPPLPSLLPACLPKDRQLRFISTGPQILLILEIRLSFLRLFPGKVMAHSTLTISQ